MIEKKINSHIIFVQNSVGIEIAHYIKEIENSLLGIFLKNQKNVKKTNNDEKFLNLYRRYQQISSISKKGQDIFDLSKINEAVIKENYEFDLEIIVERLKYMNEEPITTSEAGIVDVSRLEEASSELNNLIDQKKFKAYKLYYSNNKKEHVFSSSDENHSKYKTKIKK